MILDKEEIENERKKVAKLMKKVHTKHQVDKTPKVKKIPRPPGENYKNGWKLSEKMGLANDAVRYNAIMVRALSHHMYHQIIPNYYIAWRP